MSLLQPFNTKEYYILVAQLEQQHLESSLTLQVPLDPFYSDVQKFLFMTQSMRKKILRLAAITNQILSQRALGGRLLTLLYHQAQVMGYSFVQATLTQ